ncbi:MAG: glycosyltransferase [Woeseiaceae bacterium]|nr:glycosyltransferase [Woeseiaceae bacterium]
MAHIAYISIGMNSTVHGSLELGRRLRAAGHTVTFLSHQSIEQIVRENDFRFVRLTADDEWKQRLSEIGRLTRPFANLGELRRLRRQSMQLRELDSTIGDLRPDLVLIDIECHVAILGSKKWGVPVALPMFWLSVFRQQGLPPPHTALLPPQNVKEQIQVRLAWAKLHARLLIGAWMRMVTGRRLQASLRPLFYGTVRYSDLKDLARSRSYSIKTEADRFQWLRPHMYMQLPILSLNIYELDFPHSIHPNMSYVGPMLNTRRKEVGTSDDAGRHWQQYKDGLAAEKSRRRPLIYCSFGSYLAPDSRLLEQTLLVARQRDDWDFVIGGGSKVSHRDLENPPGNVLLMDWAPQMEVLSYASCAVVHAGISTINECIYNQVPSIVLSTHTNDQDGVAARVLYHRLGVVLEKETVTARQIEASIEHSLADESTRSALADMAQTMKDYEGRQVELTTIESLLANGRNRAPA